MRGVFFEEFIKILYEGLKNKLFETLFSTEPKVFPSLKAADLFSLE